MTVVDAPCGRLVGREDDGVLAFLGVPYAEPPVGHLRFRPPVALGPWSGERDATDYGPSSLQVPNRGIFDEVGERSEDCLYLNVWTPAADAGGRPVFVWIHGGGLRAGAGNEAMTRGAHLARRHDLVVVTINYRLGVLGGFVYLEHLGDPRLAESANAGLLDQVVALRWIRDNVEAFGGDPGRVTIGGQSSGAQSSAILLGHPEARGLVHGVVDQSGASPELAGRDDMLEIADRFLEVLADKSGVAADEIATAPGDALVAAQGPLKRIFDWGRIGHPLNPLLDGRVIDRQPLEWIREGAAAGVPVLAGSTRTELVMNFQRGDEPPLPAGELAARLADAFPLAGPDGRPRSERLAAAYSDEGLAGLDPPMPESVTALWGDKMCRMGGVRLLEAQAPHADGTWSYLFTWESAESGGVPHCLDIMFVFGTTGESVFGRFAGDGPGISPMTDLMQATWAGFVRTGSPRTEALPEWPRYAPPSRPTMLLDLDPRVVEDLWSLQRRAWD